MFIMMVVVLFARPKVGDGGDAEEVARVEATIAKAQSELDEIMATLATIPPAGDPELIRRFKEAMASVEAALKERVESSKRIDIARTLVKQRKSESEEIKSKTELIKEEQNRLAKRIEALTSSTAFVRTSRWKTDDTRPSVLLLVSGGRVSKPTVDATTQMIAPLAGVGVQITSIDDAKSAVQQFVGTVDSSKYRIEIGVWPDSYGGFKYLERVLQERGFTIQPMPVAAGESLRSGDGGSQ